MLLIRETFVINIQVTVSRYFCGNVFDILNFKSRFHGNTCSGRAGRQMKHNLYLIVLPIQLTESWENKLVLKQLI